MRPSSTLSLAGVLVALIAGSPAHGESSARDDLEPCSIPRVSREALCGKFAVPENRFNREGRKLALNVVVIPARAEERLPDPLFVLEGGPGASVVTAAASYALFFEPLLERRDLVLVDQRGTGGSGALRCKLTAGGFDADEVTACRDTVTAEADPIHYITPHAVDDIDEVRAWLGYERVNLFGGSYGSRSVLTFLRRHGDSVRAAITMATYPHDKNAVLEAAPIAQRALDGLLDLCAADERCAKAFPDLPGDLVKAMKRFDETGAVGTGEARVTRGEFGGALRLMLFFPTVAAQVPNIVHRAAAGDFEPYRFVTAMLRAQMGNWIATGTLLTILCAEDVSRIPSVDAIDLAARGTHIGPEWARGLARACAAWPRIPLPEDYDAPVRSEVPVLMLHGRLDPSMPSDWSRHAARTLKHSLIVEVPEGVHSFIGMSNAECLQGIATRFIETGSPDGIDTACVATMKLPPFHTGG